MHLTPPFVTRCAPDSAEAVLAGLADDGYRVVSVTASEYVFHQPITDSRGTKAGELVLTELLIIAEKIPPPMIAMNRP